MLGVDMADKESFNTCIHAKNWPLFCIEDVFRFINACIDFDYISKWKKAKWKWTSRSFVNTQGTYKVHKSAWCNQTLSLWCNFMILIDDLNNTSLIFTRCLIHSHVIIFYPFSWLNCLQHPWMIIKASSIYSYSLFFHTKMYIKIFFIQTS